VSELVPWWESGSEVVLNYIAAFEFDVDTNTWKIQEQSSFNTDGTRPPFDLMKQYGGIGVEKAWLAPQPGGSAFWGLGYYAAGVKGVGIPGAMFVLSTEQFWGATWYMLNQIELDRGPAISIPTDKCEISNSNCWAAGNAGEMDFLETPWNNPSAAVPDNFRRSFSTQWNQVGRKFNGGHNGGGFGSNNYLITANQGAAGHEPVIYVAVVDSVGNFVYRIPADQAADIWPGISRKTINESLQAAPSRRPSSVNPCRGNVSSDFCYVFTSNCQAKTYTEAQSEGCGFNGNQGFCGNWMAQMANTNQPLFPDDNCTRDTRGGKEMPWCTEMLGNEPVENWVVDVGQNAVYGGSIDNITYFLLGELDSVQECEDAATNAFLNVFTYHDITVEPAYRRQCWGKNGTYTPRQELGHTSGYRKH
jgi:hypothetical protein